MKKIISTILLLFFLGINAQENDLNIVKSVVFENEKYKTSLLFAKEDLNGDIFLVRNYFKTIAAPLGYYIEHYDKDLKLLKRHEIEVNRSELRGVYLKDSEIVLLQFEYIQKEKKYAFTTLTSNKEEFNFIEKEIFSIDRSRIKRYDHFGIRKEAEFTIYKEFKFGEVVESENKDFIAINLFLKNKESDSFFVVVFDKNFEKVYEHELSNINNENKSKPIPFAYQNMKIDNQGNVYLLGKIYKNNSEKEEVKGAPNYSYELFKINNQGQKQILIGDNNYFIDELQLVLKKDVLSCIGYYYKNNKNVFKIDDFSKDGIVKVNIDVVNDSILLRSYQPFEESINKVTFKDFFSFKPLIFSNLFIKNSFIDDNIIIYSEEFSIFKSDNNIQSKKSYGDILAFKVNSKGEIIWSNKIKKHQKAWSIYNIPYVSFSRLNFNKSSYFFINAEEELKQVGDNADDLEFRYSKSKNVPFMISIDENGEVDYTNMNNKGLKDLTLKVRFGILLSENSLLMEAMSDKKPLLLKISQ